MLFSGRVLLLWELWVSGSYRTQRLSGIAIVTTGYRTAAEPECVFVFVCDGIVRVSLDEKIICSWDGLWVLRAPCRMSNINHVCLNEEPRSKVTF